MSIADASRPVYRLTLTRALAMRLTGHALALFYTGLGIVFALGPSGYGQQRKRP